MGKQLFIGCPVQGVALWSDYTDNYSICFVFVQRFLLGTFQIFSYLTISHGVSLSLPLRVNITLTLKGYVSFNGNYILKLLDFS